MIVLAKIKKYKNQKRNTKNHLLMLLTFQNPKLMLINEKMWLDTVTSCWCYICHVFVFFCFFHSQINIKILNSNHVALRINKSIELLSSSQHDWMYTTDVCGYERVFCFFFLNAAQNNSNELWWFFTWKIKIVFFFFLKFIFCCS